MPKQSHVWDTIPIPINGSFVYSTEQLDAAPLGAVVTNGSSRWYKVDNSVRPWSADPSGSDAYRRVRSSDFSIPSGNNLNWMWELSKEIQSALQAQVRETLERDQSWRNGGPLRLVSIEDGYSVYVDTAGNEVKLSHGTTYMVVDFSEIDVDEEWAAYKKEGGRFPDSFLARLRAKVTDPSKVDAVHFCGHCSTPQTKRMRKVATGVTVCAGCMERHYVACSDCAQMHRTGDLVTIQGGDGDKTVCARCLRNGYFHCAQCNEHYNRRSAALVRKHKHYDDCCASPEVKFSVPNGGESLANDTIVAVTVEDGLISDTGIGAVKSLIATYAIELTGKGTHGHYTDPNTEAGKWYRLAYSIDVVGKRFKTKDGAFAKRIGKHAYKEYGLKMPESLMAKVGTTAADHSRAKDFRVSVTRELNGGPEEYGNAASCWWQSYARHRCTLKSNGGFGLLDHRGGGGVVGRTWVIPLRVKRNGARPPEPPRPTFDAMKAEAFMVFNQYGDLANHVGPRLLAHMVNSEWTYKKIAYTGDLYVNDGSAYLVGSEETIALIAKDGTFRMDFEQHSNLFHDEQRHARMKAKKEKAHV